MQNVDIIILEAEIIVDCRHSLKGIIIGHWGRCHDFLETLDKTAWIRIAIFASRFPQSLGFEILLDLVDLDIVGSLIVAELVVGRLDVGLKHKVHSHGLTQFEEVIVSPSRFKFILSAVQARNFSKQQSTWCKHVHSLDSFSNHNLSFDPKILEGLRTPFSLPQFLIATIHWADFRSGLPVMAIDATFANAVIALRVDLELYVRIRDAIAFADWTLIGNFGYGSHCDLAHLSRSRACPQAEL